MYHLTNENAARYKALARHCLTAWGETYKHGAGVLTTSALFFAELHGWISKNASGFGSLTPAAGSPLLKRVPAPISSSTGRTSAGPTASLPTPASTPSITFPSSGLTAGNVLPPACPSLPASVIALTASPDPPGLGVPMPKMTPTTQTACPQPCFKRMRSGGGGAEPPAAPEGRSVATAVAPLDPTETSSRTRVSTGDDEADSVTAYRNPDSIPWEHRGWHATRRRIYASMCRTEMPTARKHRFWSCCDHVHVMRNSDSGEIDVYSERCHDRFCLRCGQLRSRRIAECMETLMKPAADKLMFITLTVRGKPADSLTAMIDRLRHGWKELRRLEGWRNSVRGGAVMLEIKWSATSGGHWHPHYHIVCEGSWIDQQWLRDAWKLITRDSDQCDVQRIKEPAKALGYVVKYASKPMDSSFTSRPWLLDEAMQALRGVRLASCFGTWHGTPLSAKMKRDADDETSPLTCWVYEGTQSDLRAKAVAGSREAAELLEAVERVLRVRSLRFERRTSPPPDDPVPKLLSMQ